MPMNPSRETLLPLAITSVALLATAHFLRPSIHKAIFRLRLRRKASQIESDNGSVNGLFIHPVKSLRAVSVEEAELDSKGFVGDRRLMVIYPAPLPAWKDKWDDKDATHRFLTQRQCPSLARIAATMDEDKLTLTIERRSVRVDLNSSSAKRSYYAKIWDDQVQVGDLGDEAAFFFQDVVDADEVAAAAGGRYDGVRLVIHSGTDRLADPEFTPAAAASWLGASPPPVSLTDGFPILIACQASLDDLNRRLKENGKHAIQMNRFRPNIVVTGTEPFEEDKWKYIAIGDQIFALVKACPRCKQSCTDQITGKVHSEPVETMKGFRSLNVDNKEDVFFAQNAIPLGRAGKIKVGEKVRVLERGDPIYC